MLLSRDGRRRQGKWCWVRYAAIPVDGTDGESIDRVEVGFAIGRTIANAVVRNRIRRRLRAIVADESDALVPGIYLIGVKNARTATISYEDLRDDLRAVLGNAVG